MDHLANKLRIKELDDWYRVSQSQMRAFGGLSVVNKHGGLMEVVTKLYPDHQWDMMRFVRHGRRASQRWLRVAVSELFPEETVLEDHSSPSLVFSETNEPIELDVYIPSLKLALEYQGIQHYRDIHFFGPSLVYKKRDAEKRRACMSAGITLIEVPYWWNYDISSLHATIHQHRPDIIGPPEDPNVLPIPSEKPYK